MKSKTPLQYQTFYADQDTIDSVLSSLNIHAWQVLTMKKRESIKGVDYTILCVREVYCECDDGLSEVLSPGPTGGDGKCARSQVPEMWSGVSP